jgi:proliferating cell nuclear antigen PCNA
MYNIMNILINDPVKSEIFAGIFQNLRIFTDNISIHFEKTQVYIQTMDHSRVSIIELKIPAAWFNEYTHTHPTDIIIGINSSIMYKILNARDRSQSIQVVYESDTADSLSIHYVGGEKIIFNKSFTVPLVDLETDMMTIPPIDYEAEFVIPSNIFTSLIHQLKTFGDSLDVECTENKIVLCSNSIDSGKMNVDINIDDLSAYSIVEGEELKMSFSLTYLNNICAFNKLSKDMEIRICNNYPMCVVFNLTDEASLTVFLAPKISDD